MMGLRRYWPVAASALAVIVLQIVLSLTGATYYMTQITMSAYYALVVIGLCLLMGYAGQASLGHAGFFAIGGYTVAYMTTVNLLAYRDTDPIRVLRSLGLVVQWQNLYGADVLSFSPWPAFITALLLTGLIAFVIGMPVIRLKGHYLAMATLGFGLIVYRIVLGTKAMGQADGLSNVPPFHLIGGLEVNDRAPFRIQNYYIAWTVVLVSMLLAINLVHSRVGRALRSIHQSEEAAHSLGVNTYRYKLAVFVLSALFAAVGGALLTHYNRSIGPSEVTVMKSVRYVAMVAIGGMANLWGALLMAILLNFLSLRGVFGSYDDAVFGAILIAIMICAPQGLLAVSTLHAFDSFLSRSFQGRVSRRTFCVAYVLIVLLSMFGIGAIHTVLRIVPGTRAALVVYGLWNLFWVWVLLSLAVRRWHDRGKSGWMALVFLIPFVGQVWLLVELGSLLGTPGPNRYGEDPVRDRGGRGMLDSTVREIFPFLRGRANG